MSFNATVVQPATGYLGQVHDYFWSLSTAQRVLLLLVNFPIISIVLNVLSQLVRRNTPVDACHMLILPLDASG